MSTTAILNNYIYYTHMHSHIHTLTHILTGEVAGGGQVPMNVLSRDPAATDPDGPGLYWKFDNPIYGDAAPDKYNT